MRTRTRLTNSCLGHRALVPALISSPLRTQAIAISCMFGVTVTVASTAIPFSGKPLASPQSNRSKNIQAAPATKILNPYYISIATAAIAHNDGDLEKFAAKMATFAAKKDKPHLWFPATRARAFCLSRLDNQEAFSQCFAALCHAQGDIRNQNKLLKFIPPVFAWLDRHHKGAWIASAVAAALPASGPTPGKLYMYLLNIRLGELKSPLHRLQLIHQSIGLANVAIINAQKIAESAQGGKNGAPGTTPPPTVLGYPHLKQYTHALEQLRYLVVLNSFYVLKIRQLQAASQVYLGNYGAHGPHSAEVFYRMVDALGVAYATATTPQRKSEVLLAGGWLNHWYQKFQSLPGPWQNPIRTAWAKWQSVEAGAARSLSE